MLDRWLTSAEYIWKYCLLFCCRTRDSHKAQKPGISALSMTFTKGQINTGCVTHQRLVPKMLSNWTVAAGQGATLNPIYFSCLISAVSLCCHVFWQPAHGWAQGCRAIEWGGADDTAAMMHLCLSSLDEFHDENPEGRWLIWFIHCKWELHPGDKNWYLTFIKWLMAWN